MWISESVNTGSPKYRAGPFWLNVVLMARARQNEIKVMVFIKSKRFLVLVIVVSCG
jgi:hypothetical protein